MRAPDELVEKLLKGWRFLYRGGFIEGFGHLSARIPDSDLFLLARQSLGPDAEAEDFLVVAMQGRKIAGRGDLPGEYPIHLEILRARPDIGSVIHYHGLYSTAFTTSEHRLRPLHLMGTLFHDGMFVGPTMSLRVTFLQLSSGGCVWNGLEGDPDARVGILTSTARVGTIRLVPKWRGP